MGGLATVPDSGPTVSLAPHASQNVWLAGFEVEHLSQTESN